MAENLFQALTDLFARYGYWVIFFGVMLENAGLPVPGETVLLFAGFLAYHRQIHLGRAVLIAIVGATLGDSLGYGAGRLGGTALVEKYRGRFLLSAHRFDKAQALVLRHGHWAVFVARFVTGLRVVAGPLAGAFLMPYPRFLFFNFTGAVVWATTIGWVGFWFGSSWERLLRLFQQIDRTTLGVIAVGGLIAIVVYLRRRKNRDSGLGTQNKRDSGRKNS